MGLIWEKEQWTLRAGRIIFHRIFEDNVLIIFMKFYENYMATLVVLAPVHEKIQMAFPLKLDSQF